MSDIKIVYAVFDTIQRTKPQIRKTGKVIDVPGEINRYLRHMDMRFASMFKKYKKLEFTYGIKQGIHIVAVKYPTDNFSRKKGRSIVESRMKQAILKLPNKINRLNKKGWIYYDV